MTTDDKPLEQGRPGDRIIYFSGFPLRYTQQVAYARTLYNLGKVDLVQRRNSSGYMDYIAIFRYNPAVIPPGLRFTKPNVLWG